MQGGAGMLQLAQQPRPAEELEAFDGKEHMDTAHVVWVYPSMAKAKLYGLLTIHKIYSLNFAKDDGKTIAINGSREKIEETMAAITQKSSHIMVGADERLYQIYRQKDYERLKRVAKIVRQEKLFI